MASGIYDSFQRIDHITEYKIFRIKAWRNFVIINDSLRSEFVFGYFYLFSYWDRFCMVYSQIDALYVIVINSLWKSRRLSYVFKVAQ